MNIFFLDKDPKLAAQYHVDRHVVKMPLESAQMLCTAIRVLGGTPTKLTKPDDKTQVVYLLPNETYTWKRKVVNRRVSYVFVSDMGIYVQTHVNHPCNVWLRESYGNFCWLYRLMYALVTEWNITYNHANYHKSVVALQEANIIHLAMQFYKVDFSWKDSLETTPPALAMPDHCKVSSDPVKCYREYYKKEKQALHKWTNRDVPFWL